MEKLLIGQSKNGTSKTKIVWTLGPESRSVETIEKLLKAGMNVARFNFSYGSHAYHQETLDNLRTAIKNTGILCAVMLETKGPEIRTGFLKKGKPIELIQGQDITISVDYRRRGNSKIISMSYKKLAEHLKPDDVILCSDGRISLTVLSCAKDLGLVRCRCNNSGVLGEREKVYLPGIVVDLPTLTKKDAKDILQWGVPNKVDIIAVSFVRKRSDLDGFWDVAGVLRASTMLMSKIENHEGVENADEIMMRSDAVMVARGDLRRELEPWMISRAQKRMIKKANALGKPIVTALQMLESTNLTDAVLQGTDCVMLSSATATGSHPETVVQTMSRLCKEAEGSIDYIDVQWEIKEDVGDRDSPFEWAAASAATYIVSQTNAKAIIVVANSGHKAEMVAKYRPSVPILWVLDPQCPDDWVAHGLVYRGIIPLMGSGALRSTEEMIRFGVQAARNEGICNVGDTVLALRPMVDGCPTALPMVVD